MKKSVLLSVLFLFSISIIAQSKKENNVSFKVLSQFARLFPNVKDVKWDSYSGDFEGTFIEKGKQKVAIFKTDQLFATKTEIDKAALPELVKKHLTQKYKGFSII
jgi:hypothetical protein